MDTVEAILEEAGKFTSEVLAPLNGVGDKQGCTWSPDFTVTTPDGFKAAYDQLVGGGWPALGSDPAYGGQGLPHVVNVAFSEMSSAANMAFAMYPGLTHGAYSAIHAGGTRRAEGSSTCRSWLVPVGRHHEPDRAALRHGPGPPAHQGGPAGRRDLQDHAARRSGSRGGEQDLTENIIHLVLARIEGAPAGHARASACSSCRSSSPTPTAIPASATR